MKVSGFAGRIAGRLIRFLPEQTGPTAPPEWEILPSGWPPAPADSENGWSTPSILKSSLDRWPAFLERVNGQGPLVLPPDSPEPLARDAYYHNATMSFAYALARSSQGKERISHLDFGGGLGYYRALGRALFPDLAVDYCCRELAQMARAGAVLFPDADFTIGDEVFSRRFDLVTANSSLHYEKDWKYRFDRLANATGGFLFVSGQPFVRESPSFVLLQRAHSYGYDTEYPGWCLNRDEFLEAARGAGLVLVREFVIGYRLTVRGVPEPCEYLGFLFESGKKVQGDAK